MPADLFGKIIWLLTYTDYDTGNFLADLMLPGFLTGLICMAITLTVIIAANIILKLFSIIASHLPIETLLGFLITGAVNLVLLALAALWIIMLLCTLFIHGPLSILSYAGCNIFFSWLAYKIWYALFGFRPSYLQQYP